MAGATTASEFTPRFGAVRALARSWWLFLLRGVVGIAFGLLVFLFPGPGLVAILAFLAAWMLVDGVASLIQAFRDEPDPAGRHRSRAWLALDGVLSLVLAAVILLLPGLSAVALVIAVGAWAIAVGGLRVVLGWRAGDWLLGLLGALTVLVGLWLVIAPGPGLLALVWLVGLQAMVVGFLFLAFGWRLRRIARDPHGPEAAA
ncbi:HdeD family acid-resistance protein [Falsiroseomonas sp.]|uniref:HdeD family acid-resistance protein n=1 Tax=Falsiroseomonas sp. TaxID=2870721 RepID=UPI00356A98AD